MRFLSVCSGIDAASVAWEPLGWRAWAFSEIEAFPAAVLKHRFPGVPNLGDMTKFREWPDAAVDVLVGGTPCQSFSIAGLRAGLADPRGNLALVYLAIAERYRPRWLIWENVPGVLSSWSGDQPPGDLDEGQRWESEERSDFGCFLAGVSELGYGFAYRILDAQYVRVDGFPGAVPQRRRRVFVVGYLGDWRPAAAVLFERESLRGDPAPRREAGAGAAAGTLGGTGPGSGWRIGPDEAAAGHLVAADIAPAISASNPYGDHESREGLLVAYGFEPRERGDDGRGHDREPHFSRELAPTLGTVKPAAVAFGGGNTAGPIDAAACLTAKGMRIDFEVETFVVPFDTTQITHPENRSRPMPGDPAPTLAKGGHPPAVAFTCKDHGQDACADVAPTLRAMTGEHANAGGQVAVAFDARQSNAIVYGDKAGPLDTDGYSQAVAWSLMPQNSGKDFKARQVDVAQPLMAGGPVSGNQGGDFIQEPATVRRLTPTECERLQGFPDGWTAIPFRGKPAADGPRYKALGNSMAVNVMRWLGRRIDLVEREMAALSGREAAE